MVRPGATCSLSRIKRAQQSHSTIFDENPALVYQCTAGVRPFCQTSSNLLYCMIQQYGLWELNHGCFPFKQANKPPTKRKRYIFAHPNQFSDHWAIQPGRVYPLESLLIVLSCRALVPCFGALPVRPCDVCGADWRSEFEMRTTRPRSHKNHLSPIISSRGRPPAVRHLIFPVTNYFFPGPAVRHWFILSSHLSIHNRSQMSLSFLVN